MKLLRRGYVNELMIHMRLKYVRSQQLKTVIQEKKNTEIFPYENKQARSRLAMSDFYNI